MVDSIAASKVVIFLVILLVMTAIAIFFLIKKNKVLSEKLSLIKNDKVDLQKSLLKAEISVKESNYIIDNISLPIWARKEDFTISYCNAAYCKILEGNLEDILNSPEEMELYRNALYLAKAAIDKGDLVTERNHIIVNGKRLLFQIVEVPVKNNGGTIGFAYDLTDLEHIEHELKRHISVQSNLMESSASAIAIYDPDRTLKFFNNPFVTLWNFDERWLSSHPTYGEILEVLREKNLLPEQANFSVFKQMQKDMFTNLLEKHEEFFYLPDGTVLRVIVIPHEDGGLLFSYEDMTDQIALERKYNTLISVNSSTLNNLYEGVAVFGEDGRLQLNNPSYSRMWKIDPLIISSDPRISDILEETKELYNYGVEWDEFKNNIILQISTHMPSRQKLKLSNGAILDWACVPLPDGATLMTYIDVTDSYQVEQSLRVEKSALEEAQRLKTKFLENVSYELRSPLTTIKGFTEILLQNYFGELNEKQRNYVEGIFSSSLQLTGLIDNILDVASIDAGHMRLEVEEFNIHELLSQKACEIQNAALQKNINFTFECRQDIGAMVGDKKRIKQVIGNLLRNSINFVEDGGKITLSVAGDASNILISVEDNGQGIPEDKQKAVFEKFYKVSDKGNEGTGLGLNLAKRFIELHGGVIELESESNVGTKISIRLKRYNEKLQQSLKN